MSPSPSHKGTQAEARVLAELLARNFNVSIPFGSYRYDMIAEKHGQFRRLQIKCVSWTTNRNTIQVVLHSKNRHGITKYRNNEVDFFVVFYKPLRKFYIIPFKDIKGKSSIQLRLSGTGNQQRKNINLAEKYESRWNLLEHTVQNRTSKRS